MLRDVADQLYYFLEDQFPPSRDYQPSEFRKPPMPEEISHFIQQQLDTRLAAVGEVPESPWFDRDSPSVDDAIQSARQSILSTAKIPGVHWSSTLRQAADVVVAYLGKPVDTLTAFVYGNEQGALASNVIASRMQAFSAYPYLQDALAEEFRGMTRSQIERAEFAELLTRHDRQHTRGFDPVDWVDLLTPLYRLSGTKSDGIELASVSHETLARFMTEKDQPELAERLLAEGKPVIYMDLGTVLSGRNTQEAFTAPVFEGTPEVATSTPAPMSISEALAETVDMAPDPAATELAQPEATTEEGRPLWMKFEAGSPDEVVPPSDVEADTATFFMDGSGNDDTILLTDDGPGTPSALGKRPPLPGESPDEGDGTVEEIIEPETVEHEPVRLQPLGDLTPSAEAAESSGDSSDGEVVPLWMRFQDTEKPVEAKAAAPAPSPSPKVQDDPEMTVIRPYAEASLADRLAAGLKGDIDLTEEPVLEVVEQEVLGSTDSSRRGWYVRNLFRESESDYETVLRQLRRTPSWADASQVIARDVFRKNSVNIYSDAAVSFTDAVESRFRHR